MPVVITSDGSRAQDAIDTLVPAAANTYRDVYVMGHGDTVWAALEKPDLAATERFVLVDLSDTVNFPHSETGRIRVYKISVDIERGENAANGEYIVYIGVVIEVDATDGSTKWSVVMHEEVDDQATDGVAKRHYEFGWNEGLDLEVSGGALVRGVSNAGDTDNVGWQTDVALDSPAGDAASAPGAGDLVMLVEETGGTGSISICVTVQYITEAT